MSTSLGFMSAFGILIKKSYNCTDDDKGEFVSGKDPLLGIIIVIILILEVLIFLILPISEELNFFSICS